MLRQSRSRHSLAAVCLFLIVLAPSAVVPRLVVCTLCRRPSPHAARNRTRTLHTKKSLGCFADDENDRALEISAEDCEDKQLMSAAVRSSNASSCGRAGSGKLSVFPLVLFWFPDTYHRVGLWVAPRRWSWVAGVGVGATRARVFSCITSCFQVSGARTDFGPSVCGS